MNEQSSVIDRLGEKIFLSHIVQEKIYYKITSKVSDFVSYKLIYEVKEKFSDKVKDKVSLKVASKVLDKAKKEIYGKVQLLAGDWEFPIKI
ncbi:MAG TPA: hypothetical protein VF974_08180 [Patescibacteria group bacterium]